LSKTSRKLTVRRVIAAAHRRVRYVHDTIKASIVLKLSKKRFNVRIKQQVHSLPGELIVSLTSYGPRFKSLRATLECLLCQSVRPDRVILWVAHEDLASLPKIVTALTGHGLEIRETGDIGPYKKIIPALREFPAAFIVTADDDLYYAPDWLKDLIESWDGHRKQIVCHRAHFIRADGKGMLLPYNEWKQCVKKPKTSPVLFPTGGAGVLYPPESLAKEAVDESQFMGLAPRADDLWLYWMGRRAGAHYKLARRMHGILTWPGTQKIALRDENQGQNGNDIKIGNLIRHYGCTSMSAVVFDGSSP